MLSRPSFTFASILQTFFSSGPRTHHGVLSILCDAWNTATPLGRCYSVQSKLTLMCIDTTFAINMAPLILMAGHSFVKRLASDRRAHHSSDLRPTFGLKEKFSFFFQGYSGANVGSLRAEIIPFSWDRQPSHVRTTLLDIGRPTNDLADRSVATPVMVMVGDAIVALATEIVKLPYVHVVIMFGILSRVPLPGSGARDAHGIDFNSIFQQANDQLRKASATVEKLRFWPMRGVYSDPLSFLCPVGTHLNTDGMRKYTRIVRHAIITWHITHVIIT